MTDAELIQRLATAGNDDETAAWVIRQLRGTALDDPGVYGLVTAYLRSESPSARWAAVYKLEEASDLEKAIGDLLPLLHDPVEAVSRMASDVVTILAIRPLRTESEPLSAPDVRRLAVSLARGRSRWERFTAASLLCNLDEDLTAAELPTVRGLGKDEHPDIRAMGVRLLECCPFTPAVLDELRDHVADPDPEIRMDVAGILGRRKQDAAGVLPVLLEMLRDPDTLVQFLAARAVRALDPTSREPMPVLRQLSKTAVNSDIRRMAAELLRGMENL